jgi:hypothetical protein
MKSVSGWPCCEEHLALIFTRLRGEPEKATRAALMVALGDLAFRFPNAVEPWTEHLYGRGLHSLTFELNLSTFGTHRSRSSST